MKKLIKIIPILFLLTFNFCRAQDITFSDLTETTSPEASWIIPIESPTVTYKVSWQNFVNKMLAKANSWTAKQTFRQAQFDSSVTQTGNNYFSSSVFTPGWLGSGWKLDYGVTEASKSTLTVDNLTVRNKMSVSELQVKKVNAVNGNLLLTSSAKVNYVSPFDSSIVVFEDPQAGGLIPFVKNDLIYAQTYTPSGSVIRTTKATVDSIYAITINGELVPVAYVTYNEGARFLGGDVVVRFGNIDNPSSLIYLSTDDNYAPFMQLKSDLGSWADMNDSSKTIVWIGDFNNYIDPDFGALSGSGLLAKNVYLKGHLQFTNTQEVADSLWGKLTYSAAWDSLTGRPTFFNTPSGSGLYLDASHMGYYNGSNWMTYMDMAGNFYLGGTSGALQWNGSTLSITGNVTLTNQLSTSDISGLGDLATQNLADLNLGDLAYVDLVNIAKLDTTVIQGGYLKTALINTSALIVGPTWGFATGYDPSTKEDSTGVVTIIDGRVTADYVNAFTIIADSILSNSITTAKLAAGAVTASKLSVDSLSAISANLGTINAGTINASTVNVINLNASNLTTGVLDTALVADGTISYKKLAVDSLSAIASNLGSITGGSINIGSGNFTVDNAGNLTATSATLTGSFTSYGAFSTTLISNGVIDLEYGGYTSTITSTDANGGTLVFTAPGGAYINGSQLLTSGSFATVATTGDYGDLINTPSIPTATSDLTNDSGFITTSALSGYATQTWVLENYLQDGAVYAWALAATKPSYTFSEIGSKPTTISGYGITDGVTTATTVNGHALSSNVTVSKSDVGLGSVENTALSTWAGTTNITTLGTITAGTWQGSAIADSYLSAISASKVTQSASYRFVTDTEKATWNGKATASFGAWTQDAISADGYVTVTINGTSYSLLYVAQ